MAKITPERIEQINLLYLHYKTYSGVAKELHCSPATVKKYLVPNFQPHCTAAAARFTLESVPSLSEYDPPQLVGKMGDVLALTEEELGELKVLWEEISI